MYVYKGDNFCYFLFHLLQTKPILERVLQKYKESAALRSKFFHCRIDPFSERRQIILQGWLPLSPSLTPSQKTIGSP